MRKNGGFTLIELLVVMAIIGILAALAGSSFVSSQTKSRDVRRKSDLAQIGRALELFMNDHSRYPNDGGGDGRIYGCGISSDSLCDWGDEFKDENGNVYMGELPSDPRSKQGRDYFYWSDGVSYQIYTSIENDKDPLLSLDVNENVEVYSGTNCGSVGECNYGVSSSNITPRTGRTLLAP